MRVSVFQESLLYQWLLFRLGIQIKTSIYSDLRQRTETSGFNIYTLLASDPPLVKISCLRMEGWYQDSNECAPPPA